MCDNGHIQDFPWREWVHASATPSCQESLRLLATGGASLAAQKVVCGCGEERSLASITEADRDSSFLSKNLDKGGDEFLCRGRRPWLGKGADEACTWPLRGSLRSASNVYFAQVKSAIYLPRGNNAIPSELVQLLEEPPLSTPINLLAEAGAEIKPERLRAKYPELLGPFTDDQVETALRIVLSGADEGEDDGRRVREDDSETAFLRAEYDVLRTPRQEEQLLIEAVGITEYDNDIGRYFSRVMLVNKLRETRALAGFSRINAEDGQDIERRKALLWRNPPQSESSWLPAYIVYGEGIFMELDEHQLNSWEARENVVSRVGALASRYQKAQQVKGFPSRTIEPRLVLLHTFAHLLMNRLTFECGYSSAALRERLFISNNPNAPMAGVLVYTAAGDAEGTMGGLVRMGKPGYLEPVIRRALEGAQWCSADPVCMEMGDRGGQGPDSCNLAACHSCALVPETACERFNRFLDRAVVIGDLSNRSTGYFT